MPIPDAVDPPVSDAPPAPRVWPLSLAVWTAFGLLSASQSYLLAQTERQQVSFLVVLAAVLPGWYYYALATPLVFRLVRRVAPERARVGGLLVHLGAALLFAAGHALVVVVVSRAAWPMGPERPLRELLRMYLSNRLHFELFSYAAIAGVGVALEYYRKFRAREVDAARLETQLAQAQLQALKMQLHPHFLFNTLHAIAVLIREDPAAATRTVTLLGDLLRHTLAQAGTQEVTLGQELEFLEIYLEIERTRFQDRLAVEFQVPDDLLGVRVPHFILQPLVENAVRYGIARRAGTGRIEIRARRDGGAVAIEVWNDGSTLPAGPVVEGIGLATTRGRLQKLYGARGALELAAAARGVVARLLVPGRPALVDV